MIKNYRQYVNESAGVDLTKKQKNWLDKYAKGRWQFNPQTGLVDVTGNFDCSWQSLDSFKGVRFGHVSGYFYCSRNNLTSLEGAPQSVDGSFSCYYNNLTSLEGAPQSVGVDFSCSRNKLTSLKGAPQSVGWHFSCSSNNLTSLEGAPQSVGGYFVCSDNNLTSLKGFPMEIKGRLDLNPNPIWKKIEPMVKGMSADEYKLFLKFVAASEATDKESLTRIARSIERMRMI